MNGAIGTDAACEPQIHRLLRDIADCRDRAGVIQGRLEGMLGRMRGAHPESPEVDKAPPSQPGTFGELESVLTRTQARLGDIQGLIGELENYI